MEMGDHKMVVPVIKEFGNVVAKDECQDTEFVDVPAQFVQSSSDGGVHTAVLQNVQIHEAGEELPLILNNFSQNNSDENLELATIKEEIIHMYSIDDIKYEHHGDQEAIYEEQGDEGGTKNEFNGDDGDNFMGYTYEQNKKSIDNPSEEVMVKEEEDGGGELVECDMCQKVFTTTASLKRHITADHGNSDLKDDPLSIQVCPCCDEPSDLAHALGDFKCEQCDKLFVRQSCLDRHCSLEHPAGDNYFCAKCLKCFKVKKQLVDHMRVHPIKSVKCIDCSKEFATKYHLSRHIARTRCTEQPRKVFDCHVCKRLFNHRNNLTEHLRAHTGERPYLCDLCPKKFPSSGALKKHRRIHTGEKPYQCDQCDKRFTAKEALNRHWRTHTGEKPHTCQYCDKSFIQLEQLRAHIFHHTGEYAHTCPSCGLTFNRKNRLNAHIQFVHEGAEPLSCTQCEKKFFRKEDLTRHLASHSREKPFNCGICQKGYASKPNLRNHLLTHRKEPPCSCDTCGRAFVRRDLLMRHIRTKHRDVLEASIASAEKKRLQLHLMSAATGAVDSKVVSNENIS